MTSAGDLGRQLLRAAREQRAGVLSAPDGHCSKPAKATGKAAKTLIDHSVMMADSWRYDPALPFQIASAQTLTMRDWPDADLVIIDEAHTQMTVWT